MSVKCCFRLEFENLNYNLLAILFHLNPLTPLTIQSVQLYDYTYVPLNMGGIRMYVYLSIDNTYVKQYFGNFGPRSFSTMNGEEKNKCKCF